MSNSSSLDLEDRPVDIVDDDSDDENARAPIPDAGAATSMLVQPPSVITDVSGANQAAPALAGPAPLLSDDIDDDLDDLEASTDGEPQSPFRDLDFDPLGLASLDVEPHIQTASINGGSSGAFSPASRASSGVTSVQSAGMAVLAVDRNAPRTAAVPVALPLAAAPDALDAASQMPSSVYTDKFEALRAALHPSALKTLLQSFGMQNADFVEWMFAYRTDASPPLSVNVVRALQYLVVESVGDFRYVPLGPIVAKNEQGFFAHTPDRQNLLTRWPGASVMVFPCFWRDGIYELFPVDRYKFLANKDAPPSRTKPLMTKEHLPDFPEVNFTGTGVLLKGQVWIKASDHAGFDIDHDVLLLLVCVFDSAGALVAVGPTPPFRSYSTPKIAGKVRLDTDTSVLYRRGPKASAAPVPDMPPPPASVAPIASRTRHAGAKARHRLAPHNEEQEDIMAYCAEEESKRPASKRPRNF